MKRTCTIIVISIFLLISGISFGQSISDAGKLMYHERYLSAEMMLHTILKNEPENEAAWYLLSQAYLAQNKIQAIEDSLQKAPASILDKPLIKSAQGHILLKQNDVENAQRYFDAALKESRQKDPAVLAAIASAYIDTKDADAIYVTELLNKAIKRDKNNPELYVLLGDAFSKSANGSDAYSAYQKALIIDPGYARASYRMGKIFTSQKNTLYLQYFNDALSVDPSYAPALYEIYYHYYYRDVSKAKKYLEKYIAASDYSTGNDYLVTDILFLNKDYDAAISKAVELIQKEGDTVSPRIYKLLANCYHKSGDAVKALDYMQQYFAKNTDTTYLVTDYETMAAIYESMNDKTDSAARYYSMAAERANSDSTRFGYFKKIAVMYGSKKAYDQQAIWLQKYYVSNPGATNVDLFNWGLARYYSGAYVLADSVFGIYTEKYPDQNYGYYWRAKSNVAIDTAMEKGLAIPHYLKVIEMAEKDTTDEINKKRLIESYGYLASYKANQEKDYAGSIGYFEKILAIQPDNNDAKKYVGILQKFMSKDSN
jgi:tetratricopeptide (TPR) repeat protein